MITRKEYIPKKGIDLDGADYYYCPVNGLFVVTNHLDNNTLEISKFASKTDYCTDDPLEGTYDYIVKKGRAVISTDDLETATLIPLTFFRSEYITEDGDSEFDLDWAEILQLTIEQNAIFSVKIRNFISQNELKTLANLKTLLAGANVKMTINYLGRDWNVIDLEMNHILSHDKKVVIENKLCTAKIPLEEFLFYHRQNGVTITKRNDDGITFKGICNTIKLLLNLQTITQ